jgi:hypothetical protein
MHICPWKLHSCVNSSVQTLKDYFKSSWEQYGFQLPDPSKSGFCYIRLVDMGGEQAKPAISNPSKMPQQGTGVASAASPWWHSAFVNTSDFLANLECTVARAKTHEQLRWISNTYVVQDCHPILTTQFIFSLETSFLNLQSSSSSSFLHCPNISTHKRC